MPSSRASHAVRSTPERVVDDDAALRSALERLLRATALAVETFASGPELLDRLERARPQCLILDLRLPGFDGLELVDRIHALGQPTPVVFVSGRGDVRRSVEAMKRGAIDFLEKPVDADALLSAVMRGLARDAEWRQMRERAEEATRLIST